MSKQGVVAAQAGDVFEALEDAGMAVTTGRRRRGPFGPIVELEVGGCQTQPVSGVGIHVEGRHRQLLAVKHRQEASKQTSMIDREAGSEPLSTD